MTAGDVCAALDARFANTHLCFQEVKTGSTLLAGATRRLDFLAIKRSWSPVELVVAEVKVSVSDFRNDDKWPQYMELCHRFYWACPQGLIGKGDIDDRAGLIYVYPKSGKARIVKRAPYRKIELNAHMLLYLLFWRIGDVFVDKKQRELVMADIAREMRERADLGTRYRHYVAQRLNEAAWRVGEAESKLAAERCDMERRQKDIAAVKDVLDAGSVTLAELPELVRCAETLRQIAGVRNDIATIDGALSSLKRVVGGGE